MSWQLRADEPIAKDDEHMNINKYTEKAREAVGRGDRARRSRATTRSSSRSICSIALAEQREGHRAGAAAEDERRSGRRRARGARAADEDSRRPTAASQPGLSPRLKLVTDQAAGRSRSAEGRVRQHRAPASSRSPTKAADRRRAQLLKQSRRHARQDPAGAHQRPRLAARDERRIPKAPIRRSSATAATSPSWRARASSIR